MQTTERINRIKNWIIDYCKNMPMEAKTLVIGVSGGIDSSVTSTLCALTGKKNDYTFNAYHPNKSPT